MAESKLSTVEQISSIWALGGLSWGELARRVWGGTDQTDLLNRAYELAYNFLLALFPLLLFLVALLGVFATEGTSLRENMFFYFEQAVPPSAYRLVVNTLNEITQNSGGGKLTFGLLFALYTGSGGMTQLMSTLNAARIIFGNRFEQLHPYLTHISTQQALAAHSLQSPEPQPQTAQTT